MVTIKELKRRLGAGELDELLCRVYCREPSQIDPFRQRILRAAEGFMEAFHRGEDTPVVVCSAPGRTEIGGNHTDHQRGKVLTGSVDLDAIAVAASNHGETVSVCSEGYGTVSVDLDTRPVEAERNTTSSLVRGVLAGVRQKGGQIAGFDAYVASDVPGGSGLSSSACFEVLMGVVVNALCCGGVLTPEELAKIGQYAENEYFGKPSGLLDQMGCALGGVVTIDFKEKDAPKVHAVDFDFAGAGYALCIVDTGADHAGLTDDYAAVPEEMRSVARELGAEVLSEADEEEFYRSIPALRKKLGDRAVLRAIHFYTDCHRVEEQVAALERGDFDRFLRLVSSSGHSSYMYLQNVSTYRDSRDQPVAVALAVAGKLLGGRGARRVHGGGFAGTIQAFVPLDMVEEFQTGMDALLGTGACRVTYIRPVGGCVLAE